MARHALRALMVVSVFTTGAALLQGCAGRFAPPDDEDDEPAARAVESDANQEASETAGGGSVTLTVPEGEAAEFDQVHVSVCSRDRKAMHGFEKWAHKKRRPHKDKHEHHPGREGDIDHADSAAVEGGDGGDGDDVDEAGIEDTLLLRSPHQDEDDTVTVMPWPLPDHGHGEFLGWCAVVVDKYLTYKPGEEIKLEGVPLGIAVINVELLRDGEVREAGWGKALVTPHETAKAVVKVRPVAGDLDIEIVRLGEGEHEDWEEGAWPEWDEGEPMPSPPSEPEGYVDCADGSGECMAFPADNTPVQTGKG